MRSLSIVATLSLAAIIGGCPDKKPVDTDANPASTELGSVPPGIKVKDTLQAGTDSVDWKKVRPGKDGKATLVVDFGDDHMVTGAVGIYDKGGKESLVDKDVSPDATKYKLTWDVKEDDQFLLMVKATKGKGGYQLELSVEEPKPIDPCDGVECEDGKECKAGECVPEVDLNVCTPKCTGGKKCKGGQCVAPCGGPCGAGKVCNRTKDECVKDPCAGVKCADNQRCVSGTCKDKPAPPEVTCKPACAAPETCNKTTLKCEKPATNDTPPPDTCAGPLSATISSVLPQGDKSTIVINKAGTKQCVKPGMKGRINGVAGVFTVQEVYEFRCKAVIGVKDTVIGANRGVVIDR